MSAPRAALEPVAIARRNQVNAGFAGLPNALREAYGGGAESSGKFQRAAQMAETQRLTQLSGVEGDVSNLALQRGDEGAALLERILGMNFGQTTSGSQSSSSASSGKQVGAGSALEGGISGAMRGLYGDLAILRALMADGGF